ncbi:unnamed protein product [Strongylus vulgaris]|uniref:Uncharacterized protein n=1 Tax=Strongylus vulgaris TaxID=40348 RepID=A0A3P7J6V7_STRVU|nr:unnamed protein product [Strongylus vulgaris]
MHDFYAWDVIRWPSLPRIADKRAQLPRRTTMDSIHINSPPSSPPHSHDVWSPNIRTNSREAWSPTRSSAAASRDTWSPAQRSSLNSAQRSTPTSRDTSGRSRASLSSMHSPMSFLPTRETSPRSCQDKKFSFSHRLV